LIKRACGHGERRKAATLLRLRGAARQTGFARARTHIKIIHNER
jgi:hypothetical protein